MHHQTEKKKRISFIFPGDWEGNTRLTLNDQHLSSMPKFKYLGHVVTGNGEIDEKIRNSIKKTWIKCGDIIE